MISDTRKDRPTPLAAKQTRIVDELQEFLREAHPDTKNVSEEVARILEFVHQHIFDPDMNVGHVKTNCGIRNNNISTRFRAATGLTIREYIEHLRLRAARRLLNGPKTEIYLIALAVGYHHLETFYRAFRRVFGCTPLEYRDM